MENLGASWASQAVQLGPALGVPGTQLHCCPSKEAEMNLPLVISLLNFIKSVLQKVGALCLMSFPPISFHLTSSWVLIISQ